MSDRPDEPPARPDGECLFCRIVAGEIPADVVMRSDDVLAFRDVAPQAPTHVLVVPTAHCRDVATLAAADPGVLARVVQVGRDIAAAECSGQFRLVFNTGPVSGQSVFHVHAHVLGGRAMRWPPG